MSIKKEIKTLCKNVIINEFAFCYHDMSDFPYVTQWLEEKLSEGGEGAIPYSFQGKKHPCDMSIGVGKIQIQRHNTSIESHTDDVYKNTYFALAVIKTAYTTHTSYDDRLLFEYYDPQGKKQARRLNEEDVVVFNPRKPHKLTYFGRSDYLLLADVKKKRNKK